MAVNFLDFEQPIAELEAKIEELKHVPSGTAVNIQEEISRLTQKSEQLTQNIFANLTPWQITQLARHPHRPYTLDYAGLIFNDFHELHGDRMYGDDLAIVGGPARLEDRPVMLIGHQKGRDTKERVRRNYGMPKPEGYRKALRLMRLAANYGCPIVTFIDTPGAYPGLGAEERGQSEAIARNILEMAHLPVPIVTVVIGEGGSGGALAIAVGDVVLMMENSIYSVITPEGCAAILWKDASKAEQAAEALKVTAQDLLELKVIDELIPEPLGGAHRDPDEAAKRVKEAFLRHVRALIGLPAQELLDRRLEKYLKMGVYLEETAAEAASPEP
jgi:acetyl-CoA carboxylase carboxyl transferase subunit alpha